MRALLVATLVLACEREAHPIAPLPEPPSPPALASAAIDARGNTFAVQGAVARVERDPRGELRVIAIELYGAPASCADTPRSDSLTISIEPHGTSGRFELYDDDSELRCPGPDRSADAAVVRLALGTERPRARGTVRASVFAKSVGPVAAELTGDFEALVCDPTP